MSLITVVVFGVVPALHASRTDVNLVLKGGGRSAKGARPRIWTAAFLTAELGTMGAVAWDRAFSSESRNLYASAPQTVLTIAGLLIAIVAISCLIPLRRAVRMNPVAALRHD
jgi:ABC-type antimicrobial peptide transport system permease subunit